MYDSYVRVENLPQHLEQWEKSLLKHSNKHTNDQSMYWLGLVMGLIASLSVAAPVTMTDLSVIRPVTPVYSPYNQSHVHFDSAPLFVPPLVSQTQYITGTNAAITMGIAVFACLIVYLYTIIARPLLFERPLTAAERQIALRRTYPDLLPPFPNAWFRLCNDYHLNVTKQSNKVEYEPYVIDAFDHQFTVQRFSQADEQSVIRCVDETGREWEVCEVNRTVFIWHDVNNRASSWQIPMVTLSDNQSNQSQIDQSEQTSDQLAANHALEASTWQFVGATSHEIMCHIAEIPENGADTAHLDYLHGAFILDWLTGNAANHTWSASWQPGARERRHLAEIRIRTSVAMFGLEIPGSAVNTRITQVGPGIVQLLFPLPFGNVLLQETITPIHANLQRATHVVYAQNTVPKPLAKLIMKSTLIQFERDFIVWNSKRWIRSPLAVKEDGPILKYRRWMKQFYDEDGGELRRDYAGQSTYVSRLKH